MTTPSGYPALSATPRPGDVRLEILRRHYESEIVAAAARVRRTVRVAPYVLAGPGAERQADLKLIEEYVSGKGWHVTRSSFADLGQAPPITERSGFGEASLYAAQGFAHGIVAIARTAITTDNETYARVLDHLYLRGVFLAYLPAEDGTPA